MPILFSAVLGILTAVSFAIASKFGLKGGPNSPIIAMIGVMVAGAATGLMAADRFFPRRWHHPQPARAARLNWVVRQSGAIRRVPHRFVEYGGCGGNELSAALHPDGFPIGVGVAILPDKRRVPPLPEPNAISFEPIHLGEPIENLGPILQGLEEDTDLRKWDRRAADSAARDMPLDWRRFLALAGVAILSWLVFSNFIVVILLAYTIHIIVSILRRGAGVTLGPRYWLVPGGIIESGSVMAGKEPGVRLYTPQNASLIVDLREPSGIYVATHESPAREPIVHLFAIPAKPSSCLAAMAAWRSIANPPTLEQVNTLMDAS